MKKHDMLSGLLLALMTLFTLSASALQGGDNTPDKNYLCFTAEAANSTIKLERSGSPTAVTIQYQVNGTDVKSGEDIGFYRASTTDAADKASNLGFKKSNN